MVKKIMVVDDDPGCLETVKQALEMLDDEYKVISVSSGIKCLELLNNDEIPDLILLDIMMPEMSGWETLKNIQQNLKWKDIPVVFLTARTDDIAQKTGSFLAEDYITKPFNIEDLQKSIDKVLKKTGRFQKEDIRKRIDKVLSDSNQSNE